MINNFARLKYEIATLKRNRRKGRARPHKLIMLLAILDLADENLLSGNCIRFDDSLISRFKRYFAIYNRADDYCQPGPPFFHLRSSPFWNHKVKPGREDVYSRLSSSGGGPRRIIDNIDYAYLSDYAYDVLRNPKQRQELRAFIEVILDREDVDYA